MVNKEDFRKFEDHHGMTWYDTGDEFITEKEFASLGQGDGGSK